MSQIAVATSQKTEPATAPASPKFTPSKTGIHFHRHFTAKLDGKSPYDELVWEKRNATIGNDKGSVIFEQRDVVVPADWSQTATNIVASKYFHGKMGSPERESSVGELVHRVVDTIADWGLSCGYFAAPADGENFRDELAHLMLHQKAAFNSPVWFNVGVKESRGYGWFYDAATDRINKMTNEARPQCSACFIVSVKDSLESILDLAKTEGMLFKWGSGTGSNLSALREEDAILSGGGRASGPLSFMKGFDAFAGVIKSGGKTRRAAKMVILNAEHPDIERFVWCKAKEEKKAHTLIEAGYDSSLDGDAYSSIFFQNANNSVRATDEFMQAVVEDREWWTRSVNNGEKKDRMSARDLMRQIAEATWQCGDPGMQFDTTINRWHPCPNTSRINASNPCSEYMFLDDSACNLSSLNLMKFVGPNGQFDVEALPPRRGYADRGAGNSGGQRRLSDGKDRAEFARLPAARARVRQSGRAADVVRHSLRQRPRPRLCGRDQRDHVRPGLSHQRADRGIDRTFPRLCEERRAVPRSDPDASRFGARDQPPQYSDAICSRARRSAGMKPMSWANMPGIATAR